MAVIFFDDLDKALVLAALYNGAKAFGKDIKSYNPEPMTYAEAKKLVLKKKQFDYINGRVLLVIFIEDTFNSKLYNKNNGQDAAEIIVESLRKTGDANNLEISSLHKKNMEKETQRILKEYSKKK